MLSKNFSRSEFACRCGCGFDTVDAKLISVLQDVRNQFGAISINSGCRCEAHNKYIGGSKNSQHLLGRAADIVPKSATVEIVAQWVKDKYPSVSVGLYSTFVHIDTRSTAPWRQ